jgi:NADH-quinone oxidoreductase subunit L
MPVTFVTFGLAYLAIIGLPPFAGYWTKDKIVEAAFAKGGTSGTILGIAALVGAGITAYYMTRMMILTFFGEPRWDSDVHPHESPKVMTWPIIALSVGSVAGGAFLIIGDRLGDFLKPVTGNHEGSLPIPAWGIALITLGTVVAGIAVAYLQYVRRTVPRVAPAGNAVVVAARRDLYGDAINESLFMRPGQYLSRILVFFDNRGVDGTVNGLAAIVGGSSGRLRRIQNGFVRSYALSMFVGAAAVVCALLLVRI